MRWLRGFAWGLLLCYLLCQIACPIWNKKSRHNTGTPGAVLGAFLPLPPSPPDNPTDGTFGPYVQSPTAISAVICWRTAAKGTGRVDFSSLSSSGGTIEESTSSNFHQITLGGLQPNTLYSYTARSYNGPELIFNQEGSFRTAPLGGEPLTFVHMGETHTENIVGTFSSTILNAQPHLIVDSSDFVDHGNKVIEYDRMFTIGNAFYRQVPLVCAVGNHSYAGLPSALLNGLNLWKSVMKNPGNEEWFTLRQGNVQFWFLNSTWHYMLPNQVKEQDAWLVDTLKQADDGINDPVHRIAVFHIPPYSSGPLFRELVERLWVRSHFFGPLQQYGVKLILVGHDKFNEHSVKDGIHVAQVATGELDKKFQTPNSHSKWKNASQRTIGVITVNSAVLTYAFLNAAGTTLHQFQIGP